LTQNRSIYERVGRRGASIFVTEGAGFVVSMGAVATFKRLLPSQTEAVQNFLARKLLASSENSRPWRDVMTEQCQADPTLGEFCPKLLDPSPRNTAWLDAHKPDITPEQRAQQRAEMFFDAALAGIVSAVVRMGMQHYTEERWFGINNGSTKRYAFSQGAEVAVMGATMLGTLTYGHEQTMVARMRLRNMFEKIGFNKDKAGDLANYTVYNGFSNATGIAAGLLVGGAGSLMERTRSR
jgi:hypothetical protein